MRNILLCVAVIVSILSCTSSDPEPAKSGDKKMISFSLTQPVLSAVIDTVNNSVYAVLPLGTDFTNLTPTLSVSEKATVVPASGTVQDFTKPVIYTVTAEDGTTKAYTVTIAYFVDIVGKWKIDFYLDSKLQSSLRNDYIQFFNNKTYSYSQKNMETVNSTVQLYWGADKYSVQSIEQYKKKSAQNAKTLDDSGLSEQDAPFIVDFLDGAVVAAYKIPGGNPRSTYGYPFAAKASGKDAFTIFVPVKDNLLELRLSRMN